MTLSQSTVASGSRFEAHLQSTLVGGEQICVVVVALAKGEELTMQLGEATFEMVCEEFANRLLEYVANPADLDLDDPVRARALLRGVTSQEHMELAAAKLERLMSAPVDVVNHSVSVRTHSGFLLGKAPTLSAEDMLDGANSALKSAQQTQTSHVLFNPEQLELENDRIKVKATLQQALHKGEFVPFFEPLLHLGYNTVVGASASNVWMSPKHGTIPEQKFRKSAIEAGLQDAIALQFLKASVSWCAQWPNDMRVVVPLPPELVGSETLVQEVADAIAVHDLNASRLVVEIPESVFLLDNRNDAFHTLKGLHDLSITVRLARVGDGGLPLSLLNKLPIDEISFAPSFMGKFLPMELKKQIFSLLLAAGIDLVALHATNQKHALFYKELGFAFLQGKTAGDPLSPDHFEAWLKKQFG